MSCEGIKLEQPLFYKNEFGLRFEIGPTTMDVWADFDKGKVNQEYFNIAFDTSISIFEAVFSSTDDISIAYQIFSDGRRKIQKRNYLFKQVNNIKNKEIIFTHHRNIYTEDLDKKCQCWRRATISNIKVKDVNAKNILLALINTDFSFRKPSLRGECFFLNHTKGIVLNLYDDRGMDVVSLKKDSLLDLYRSHNRNILEHNREQIDYMFSQVP